MIDFAAFMDIGVHQDGLVRISALSDKFIKNPRNMVKTGDVVKAKILSVDAQRKRISLSVQQDDALHSESKHKQARKLSAALTGC